MVKPGGSGAGSSTDEVQPEEPQPQPQAQQVQPEEPQPQPQAQLRPLGRALGRWRWLVRWLFRIRRLQRIWGHLGQFLQRIASKELRNNIRDRL